MDEIIFEAQTYINGHFHIKSPNYAASCNLLNVRNNEYHFRVSERDKDRGSQYIATISGNFLGAVIDVTEYILQLEKEKHENNKRRGSSGKSQLSDFG